MAYYVGSYAALDPTSQARYGNELFTGYIMPAGRIGSPTGVQTANQLAEVNARLNEGMKTIEVQTLSPELLETVPKQHFQEIQRLAKLADADITFHAPTVDPSGFTQQGWSEAAREQAEQQLLVAAEKAHSMNPTGNIPVTIHASAIPAAEWRKSLGGDEKEMMVVVNPESGEISGMRREKVYYPELKEAVTLSPEKRLDMTNHSQWRNTLLGIQDMKRHADEMLGRAMSQQGIRQIAPLEASKANMYYEDIELRLSNMFDLAYKSGDERVRKELNGIKEKWVESSNEMNEVAQNPEKVHQLPLMKQIFYDEMIQRFGVLGQPKTREEAREMRGKPFAIRILKPVEEFAKQYASETVGNVAFKSFKEFGETAPIISVENFMPNMAFSRADQLKELIKSSRQQFVKQAVKSGMKEVQAEKQAKKLIGATWDTGHINLLRKYGYSEEEIVKESKKIAPYVKHVHMVDNFGLEETHLPPGMGNVPIGKIMKEMKKAGFNGRAIVEAGNFVAQFKTSPHQYSLEAVGAPIYGPAAGGPAWSQAMGAYGGPVSYGAMFPEQHFSMYGAGFSSLPSALGGQMPGKQSRFSGAPME